MQSTPRGFSRDDDAARGACRVVVSVGAARRGVGRMCTIYVDVNTAGQTRQGTTLLVAGDTRSTNQKARTGRGSADVGRVCVIRFVTLYKILDPKAQDMGAGFSISPRWSADNRLNTCSLFTHTNKRI